jgi:crystallin, alpha B
MWATWNDLTRPSRLLDQHFGLGVTPDELLSAFALMPSSPREMMRPLRSRDYYRPWATVAPSTGRRDTGSIITADKDKFQVCLDVQQFAPNEITVKTVGNQIVIEGKHEEKEDEHGYISRQFVRKYVLPEGHNIEDVISSLSSDGVLSITAPKKKPEAIENERVVTIVQTGPAHSAPIKSTTAPKEDQKMQE